jgi:hypothetical protein
MPMKSSPRPFSNPEPDSLTFVPRWYFANETNRSGSAGGKDPGNPGNRLQKRLARKSSPRARKTTVLA